MVKTEIVRPEKEKLATARTVISCNDALYFDIRGSSFNFHFICGRSLKSVRLFKIKTTGHHFLVRLLPVLQAASVLSGSLIILSEN